MPSIILRVTSFHFIFPIHHLRLLLMIVMVAACIIILVIIVVHLAHPTIVHVVIVSTVTACAAFPVSQLFLDKF